jgi:Xaa-Pro aminopeptidase
MKRQLLALSVFLGLISFGLAAFAVAGSPATDSTERFHRLRRERIERYLLSALQQNDVDLWLVLTRENNPDPLAADLAAEEAVLPAALLFEVTNGKLRRRAICANFDVNPFRASGIYDEVLSYGREGLLPHLRRIVQEIDPARIAVNISEMEPIADGLSAGLKSYLERAIGSDYAGRLVPAEGIISSFRSRKVPEEIELYRRAVALTIQLEEEALSPKVIQPGVTTELDIANFLRRRMQELGFTCAWGGDGCPSVVAGPNRGYSAPTDAVIERGRTVRIDFGIKMEGYCTDIQRTAYVLREGETEPPPEIQRLWETVVRANEAAVAQMRPGVTAQAVDAAARSAIVEAGYDEFVHATGHAVGFFTHDVGPLLGPDWPDRYGRAVFRQLESGQIFAVEPSAAVEVPWMDGRMGVGLEEEVLVTADGAEYLGGHQTKLILLR